MSFRQRGCLLSQSLSPLLIVVRNLLHMVTMLYQQTAFLILTLLIRLALAITPVDKSQDEKLDGYVGYLPTPPTGDWLTATYCYCSQPHHLHQLQTPAADEGSFFQWEYYNYHQNATFIMHLLCERNHADDDDCVSAQGVLCASEPDNSC